MDNYQLSQIKQNSDEEALKAHLSPIRTCDQNEIIEINKSKIKQATIKPLSFISITLYLLSIISGGYGLKLIGYFIALIIAKSWIGTYIYSNWLIWKLNKEVWNKGNPYLCLEIGIVSIVLSIIISYIDHLYRLKGWKTIGRSVLYGSLSIIIIGYLYDILIN